MHSDRSYRYFSEHVYKIDPKHEEYEPNLTKDSLIVDSDINYKILQTENNPTNGMQAMAVAPIVNDKAETSEVVIAYAGTNLKDPLDIMTDAQTVVFGNKVLIPKSQQLDLEKHQELDEQGIPKSIEYVDGQVMSAEKFVEDIQVDYPHATITTTGIESSICGC